MDLPFTNKAMGQKLHDYRMFISKYLVQAQKEKYLAVTNEKKKWVEYYEAKSSE